MHRLIAPSSFVAAGAAAGLLGILTVCAPACGGAADQDVLAKQGGGATAASSTSGAASSTSGTSGVTSGGTSSSTSGDTSGGTTSGGPPNCTREKGDSDEKHPVKFDGSLCGAIKVGMDTDDWGTFERPPNKAMKFEFSGRVRVTLYDPPGNGYEVGQTPSSLPGPWLVQIQYDFVNFPVPGDQKAFEENWSVTIRFE